MDEEKMQRQMEFIVEQQAQFAAKIGQLEDTTRQIGENVVRLGGVVERLGGVVERLGEVVERLSEVVGRVVDGVARLTQSTLERFDETDRKLAALVDAQVRAEDRTADVDRKFALLAESQQKTEESIRSLAEVFNRHTADGHGGRGQAES
jgi:ABC-type transporter Mla subunit MlaD